MIQLSNLRQEDMLSFYFYRSLELEELLIKKYDMVKKPAKGKNLEPILQDFKKNSSEHIKDLREKMNLLGIQ